MSAKLNKIEKAANNYLASVATLDSAPKSDRTRCRIVSVAYQARGQFEATDINGVTDNVSLKTVEGWLK